MAKLILLIPLLAILIAGTTTLAFSQGPPPGQGPPKVDIFARQVGNAILVTWENPSDTEDDIVFLYQVSRDVNRTEAFVPIFDSLRNTEEKIINEQNGQEMFFFLDQDIKAGSDYTYQISAGRTQGNPNPTLSDDTRPIFILENVFRTTATSQGHLIVTSQPIPPITPIMSWVDWLPIQLINAEVFSNFIFQTTVNPQIIESFRLALEPIPAPADDDSCNQSLEVQYSKNIGEGQDFKIVTTIIENQISRDDISGEGTLANITSVEIIRHQKTWQNFTDTDKVKQKWLVIKPENQTIHKFINLEIQFDIIAETADPADHRSLSVWNVFFTVPSGINAC